MFKFYLVLAALACLIVALLLPDEAAWLLLQDTDAAYEEFVKAYPESRHVGDARSSQDDLSWLRATELDDAPSYRRYLERFPDGLSTDKATERLDEREWAEAERSGTVAAYEQYLDNFPGGLHRCSARFRATEGDRSIHVLKRLVAACPTGSTERENAAAALEKEDNLLFEEAKASGSVAGLRDYIWVLARPRHSVEAESLIREIEDRRSVRRLLDLANAMPPPSRDRTAVRLFVVDRGAHGRLMRDAAQAAYDGPVTLLDMGGTSSRYQALAKIVMARKSSPTTDLVVNLSWGADWNAFDEVVFDQMSRAGIVFVGAAGNEGSPTLAYPAAYESVISVGSVDPQTQLMKGYSNYGWGLDFCATDATDTGIEMWLGIVTAELSERSCQSRLARAFSTLFDRWQPPEPLPWLEPPAEPINGTPESYEKKFRAVLREFIEMKTEILLTAGTSFAAAVVSGRIAELLDENRAESIDTLLEAWRAVLDGNGRCRVVPGRSWVDSVLEANPADPCQQFEDFVLYERGPMPPSGYF